MCMTHIKVGNTQKTEVQERSSLSMPTFESIFEEQEVAHSLFLKPAPSHCLGFRHSIFFFSLVLSSSFVSFYFFLYILLCTAYIFFTNNIETCIAPVKLFRRRMQNYATLCDKIIQHYAILYNPRRYIAAYS